ncbi:MAG: PocR ligand-binding domain-containing protein [Terriglobales bacterium]
MIPVTVDGDLFPGWPEAAGLPWEAVRCSPESASIVSSIQVNAALQGICYPGHVKWADFSHRIQHRSVLASDADLFTGNTGRQRHRSDTPRLMRLFTRNFGRSPTLRYGAAVVAVLLGLGLGLLMRPGSYETPYLPFYVAVLLAVIAGGFKAGLLATFISAIAVQLLFLPPHDGSVSFNLGNALRGGFFCLASGVICWLIDRRKVRADADIARSEADLRRAQALALTGNWRLDVQRNELWWSDETYHIFDVPKGTLLTYEKFLAAVHPDDREHVDRHWQAALAGAPYDIEHRILVNGTVKWVRETAELEFDREGKLLGGFGAVQDITERKQVEEALRLSEERLRVAAMAAEIGVWYWTPGTNYVEVSANWRRLFGVAPEVEVTFETWRNALHPEDRDRVVRELNAASAEHREFDVEYRALRPDGSVCWIVDRGRASYDKNGFPVSMVGINVDITGQKLAEKALRQSEQRVRLKLDSILSPQADIGNLQLADVLDTPVLQMMMEEFHKFSRVPMAIIDLEGRVLVGVGWQDICTKFHRVNQQSCKHCVESDVELSAGIPPGEYRVYRCKNNMWDVATPITVGGKHVGNVFTGQFFFEGESPDLETFRAQARQYGFDEKAYLAALDQVPRLSREALAAAMTYFMKLAEMVSKLSYSNIKLARSLAERDALTESLRSREAHLRLALDAAKSGTWEWDLQTNQYTWSDEVWDLHGLPANSVEPSYETWLASVHPADRKMAQRVNEEAARSSSDLMLEYRVKAGDSIRWLMARGRPVRDASGHLTRFVGIVMDVTERKRAEEALIRTEKLASVGRLAATIAHEINNPLSAVINTIYIARSQSDISRTVRTYLDLADEELKRITHITRQVLGFYRESANPTRISVQAVLNSAIDLLKGKIEAKGISVNTHYTAQHYVTGLPGELRQVFCNLLSNSVEAIDGNGAIRLRVSRSCHFSTGQSCVRITVADNGKGIDDSVRPHIFEPFFTTKGATGTGLGLWVCKQLVEKHGGSIRIRSRAQHPRTGTVFSILLPAAAAAPAAARTTAGSYTN